MSRLAIVLQFVGSVTLVCLAIICVILVLDAIERKWLKPRQRVRELEVEVTDLKLEAANWERECARLENEMGKLLNELEMYRPSVAYRAISHMVN